MKSLNELNIQQGSKVFVRVDHNVPMENGVIKDDTRIRRTLPTLRFLLRKRATLIIASHLGRPKGKKIPELSLEPVAKVLEKLLDCPIKFIPEVSGELVQREVFALKAGEIAYIENLRFEPGERENDQELAKKLRNLAKIYVNEAFSASHRTHTSVNALPLLFEEKCAGFLMFEEIENLSKVRLNPSRPAVAVLGGAKIEDKIGVIKGLLDVMDEILIGGGMVFTFWKKMGKKIGNSLLQEDYLDEVANLIETGKITIAVDAISAPSEESQETKVVTEIPEGESGFDIGPESVNLFEEKISKAKTIFWNGPLGVFEKNPFRKSSLRIASMLANRTRESAFSLIGGGETISATALSGCSEDISFISTGGGASLKFMEKGTLPGIEVL